MRTVRLVSSLLLLGAVAFSGAVSADWIVLKSGVRIETKGPWTLRGKMVQFTSRQGRLQALPLDEVDLAASQNATGPDPNRPAREAVGEGDQVLIGVEKPMVTPTPLPGGYQLRKFILDPNAPRVSGTISFGKSTLATIYEKFPRLRYYRDDLVRRLEPGVVEAFEQRFENGYYDLSVCYSDDPSQTSPARVEYCLAQLLALGFEALKANPTPTPTSTPPPTMVKGKKSPSAGGGS